MAHGFFRSKAPSTSLLTLVRKAAEAERLALVNSVNPYRLEGQKTVAFEICDALGRAPDWLALPVGNAGNITAAWMGFRQHQAHAGTALPRLLGVQAEGAAPLVVGHPIDEPETIATAIRIGHPARGDQALAAAEESGGRIVAASDLAILQAQSHLAGEGLWVEPASAAGLAGLLAQIESQGSGAGRHPDCDHLHRARVEGPGRYHGPHADTATDPRHRPSPVRGPRAMIVSVDVPASTANLGPGFDCLGLALELRNELRLHETGQGLQVEIAGEGSGDLPADATNLIVQAAFAVFERLGERRRGLSFRCINRIPLGSGLGSSAAAAVAGALAANALVSGGLSLEQILGIVFEMEGHADNAAASLYGGLNAVASDETGLIVRQLPAADLTLAVVVPEVRLPTQAMRQTLPSSVALKDAVFNLGHSLLLIEALRTGDLELLSFAAEDRLHQPYRLEHIPGFEEAEAAARSVGARAVTLSGAGPGLVAFGSQPSRVAEAMQAGFERAGIGARSWTLPIAFKGARLQVEDSGG